MRIIAGTLRGRRLEAPPGRATRPMLDRVRESLFQTLAGWLPDARVLDLFAGSGSLGFEAVSRGARAARLVDGDEGVVELLRRNAEALGVLDRVEVRRDDALEPGAWGPRGQVDVVFFDPPYPLLREPDSRAAVLGAVRSLAREHVAAEGIVVFHAPRREVREEELGPNLALARRTFGTNALWFVQREEDARE